MFEIYVKLKFKNRAPKRDPAKEDKGKHKDDKAGKRKQKDDRKDKKKKDSLKREHNKILLKR